MRMCRTTHENCAQKFGWWGHVSSFFRRFPKISNFFRAIKFCRLESLSIWKSIFFLQKKNRKEKNVFYLRKRSQIFFLINKFYPPPPPKKKNCLPELFAYFKLPLFWPFKLYKVLKKNNCFCRRITKNSLKKI